MTKFDFEQPLENLTKITHKTSYKKLAFLGLAIGCFVAIGISLSSNLSDIYKNYKYEQNVERESFSNQIKLLSDDKVQSIMTYLKNNINYYDPIINQYTKYLYEAKKQ